MTLTFCYITLHVTWCYYYENNITFSEVDVLLYVRIRRMILCYSFLFLSFYLGYFMFIIIVFIVG